MAFQGASEVEQLRRQLQAAEQRAGAAEQRAGAAEQRAGTAEHLLREERERSERTSLPEFLRLCHKLLSSPLCVQSDRSLTTKGSLTSPRGKMCPTSLRPWLQFPKLQQHYFDEAYSLLNPEFSEQCKFFSPRLVLKDLGHTLCRRPLASEKDLEHYQRFAVEEKVKDIMDQLVLMEPAKHLLKNLDYVQFENHLNTLGDSNEEVMQSQKQSRTDEACIFRTVGGRRNILFVVEYKAAHKLSVEYLRAGLRPMQLREEVISRQLIPTGREERLNYNADRLVAAAVTQTFEYMIENGLEFSCIVTGPATVFLRVLDDDPTTVYYYLTEPNLDVGQADGLEFRYPFTAISRMVGFCLLALQSPVRDQAWRDAASRQLNRWEVGFDDILREIPREERTATPPASAYKPPAYPIDPRSPYLLRPRRMILSEGVGTRRQNTESSSSEGSFIEPSTQEPTLDTPSRSNKTKRKRTSGQEWKSDYKAIGKNRSPDYCTQRCLLGLKRQQKLDPACPNVQRHQQYLGARYHQLSLTSFHQQVQAQLTADMDHNCTPLGMQGARGALFKITLSTLCYTFVAKGTVQAFVDDLRHEGKVYEQLDQLQGSVVPVCLGNMDLDRTYYLDFQVRIVHMLYMAWGGTSLDDHTLSVTPLLLEQEKQRSINELDRSGVLHKDLRLANMLWSTENQRVMLIDFERSVMKSKKRASEVLQVLSSNKRLRRIQRPVGLAGERAHDGYQCK